MPWLRQTTPSSACRINQAVLAPDAQTDGGRLSAYLARSPTMKCASQGKVYVVTAMRPPTR
jgi:hypothetical protein